MIKAMVPEPKNKRHCHNLDFCSFYFQSPSRSVQITKLSTGGGLDEPLPKQLNLTIPVLNCILSQ